MTRNFPATARAQGIFNELFDKERDARLATVLNKEEPPKEKPVQDAIPKIPAHFRIKPKKYSLYLFS